MVKWGDIHKWPAQIYVKFKETERFHMFFKWKKPGKTAEILKKLDLAVKMKWYYLFELCCEKKNELDLIIENNMKLMVSDNKTKFYLQ